MISPKGRGRPKRFEYSPLETSETIRILELQPGVGQDPICCRLRHFRFRATPYYEALSYRWGDPGCTEKILCGNKILYVTKSVFVALRRLRSPYGHRMLWIDFICINQQDISERGHQVKIMFEIYRNARQVLVWLGDVGGRARKIACLFRRVHEVVTQAGGHFDGSPPTSIHAWSRSRLTEEEIMLLNNDEDWKHANLIFKNEYFGRVWVMQEIGIASKATVLFGTEEFEWPLLVTVATFLHNEAFIIRTRWGIRPYRVMQLFRLFHDDFMVERSVSYLLSKCRELGCTDPSDRLYSLLAHPLLRKLGSFDVDYSRSLEDTYIKFTKEWIGRTGSVGILSLTQPKKSEKPIPSWTLELRKNGSRLQPLAMSDNDFCAALDSRAVILPTHSESVLRLRGLIVDRVGDHTIPLEGKEFLIPPYGRDRPEGQPPYIFELWASCVEWPIGSNYSDLKERFFAFLLTLLPMANVSQDRTIWCGVTYWERAKNENSASQETLSFSGDPLEEVHRPSNQGMWQKDWIWYMNNTKISAYERCLFYTKGGLLGLGPVNMKPGDIICVLFGGGVPYVLRENGGEGQYTLIGECYIKDLVHGETFKQWEAGDTQMVELEIV